MNRDESAVRELLLTAQHEPALLDTHQVLLQGRRRLRRRRLAPVVGLVLVAAVAGGMVAAQTSQKPPGVTSSVSAVPGEVERIDVSDQSFGVAARRSPDDNRLFLVVFLPGAGGWTEVSGAGVMDQLGSPATIFLGNTQFPRVSFAALPAGSTSIRAVFTGHVDYQLNAVSVRGADGKVYVIVAVVTASSSEAASLLGLTWVDEQGRPQRYTPFGG